MFLALFYTSCRESPKSRIQELKDEIRNDSIKRVAKEMTETKISEILSDTSGVYKAPVQVLKAKFVERDYSNYKDIQLTYKNVSNKDISAIRFK
jgi:hypothetical protein